MSIPMANTGLRAYSDAHTPLSTQHTHMYLYNTHTEREKERDGEREGYISAERPGKCLRPHHETICTAVQPDQSRRSTRAAANRAGVNGELIFCAVSIEAGPLFKDGEMNRNECALSLHHSCLGRGEQG